MMKRLGLILGFVLCVTPAQAGTWSYIQKGNTNASSATTCTLSLDSSGTTTAGDLLVYAVLAEKAGGQVNLSGVSGGGTFVHCPSCAALATGTYENSVDGGYVLSATGGVSSFTFTYTNGATTGNGTVCIVAEFRNAGGVYYDASAHATSTATNPAETAITLSGNDLVVQFAAYSNTGFSAVSGSPAFSDFPWSNGWAAWTNVASLTTPTWTGGGGATANAFFAIAFKDTASAPACAPSLALLGVGRCG